MELTELIESKVVAVCCNALQVINCCLVGTATHKLYDLLESVFGPDIHVDPTQDTDLKGEDYRIDEQ